MNGQTLSQLVRSAREGNLESFGLLYERYYAAMVGVAYSLLGDRHLAEDAAQEAFASACGDIARLKRPEKFAGWLRQICRNVAIDIVRSRARGAAVVKNLSPPTANDADGRPGEAVRRAVMELPPRGREVVLLHYFSGLSYGQIAETIGGSVHSVRGRLFRARRELAAKLSREGTCGSQL